jgi:predicted negative regulator of RcsB-dependent stress response
MSRRELREDEIQSTLQSFGERVIEKKNELLVVFGVIVALLLGVGIWRTYSNRQNEEVQAQLGRVVAAFNEIGTPPAERFKKVVAEGEKTVASYGTLPAGYMARYYMAFGHEGLGDKAKAISLLEEVAGHSEGDLQGMARFAMAQIQARSGDQAKAIEILKDLFEKGGYAKDAVAIELGRAHEAANQNDQAKGYYEKVITDFQGSPFRSDAESSLRRMGFPLPAATPKNPS